MLKKWIDEFFMIFMIREGDFDVKNLLIKDYYFCNLERKLE